MNTDEISDDLLRWRQAMAASSGVTDDDLDELEDHLLAEYRDLYALGLRPDEAFLLAARRLGQAPEVADEFLRVHPDRAWQQFTTATTGWHLPFALGLGLLAGIAVRLPASLLGDNAWNFYLRGGALLTLAFLAIYLLVTAESRDRVGVAILVGGFALSAVLVGIYPSRAYDQTQMLTAIHLPIFLLALTGLAYLGGRWRSLEAWMDWIRYLGEGLIYYVLTALGGGAVIGLLIGIFTAVGLDDQTIARTASWVVPVLAIGALLVCAWLVEQKKAAMSNMAPVLTAIFTPVLAVALLAFLVVAAMTGNLIHLDRSVLIIFDLLLIVVAAIVLFTVSARPPESGPRALDWMQLALICCAIIVDLLLLWALSGRVMEYGSSPNKLAALIVNLLLLVHLAGSAFLYVTVLRGAPALRLVLWQCATIPLFAAWAAFVAFVFPPLFGFM